MKEVIEKLSQDELFVDWNKNHSNSFLSHFFVQVNGELNLISPWEIGFFDNENKKITVFTEFEGKSIIKPADDVFKKENDEVEKLILDNIKINLKQAKETCLKQLPELFPGEVFGNGFLILQCWKNEIVWNFTLITKTLKFSNLKVSAISGEVTESQAVDLVDK